MGFWEGVIKALERFLPAAVAAALAVSAISVLVVLGLVILHPGRSVHLGAIGDISWDAETSDPSGKLGWTTVKTLPKTLSTFCEYRLKALKGQFNAYPTFGVDDVFLYPAAVATTRIFGVTGTGDNFWYSVVDVKPDSPNATAYTSGYLRMTLKTGGDRDFTAELQKRCSLTETVATPEKR